ncbi:YaaA family protein [Cryobacterium tagatosivorans]|uniref:Peroxide stress protein YaaA n=1 Tax=Cryobacterium tagatosivorans TaxID=1259199 RepID=A0A4V3I694_9MICO|nr:peroxide stress protein YaaA [Cryobacterium tagatosivorans]TFB48680.1 peroxide stress protein YaaA [Cryobacterium tagatosivorans]
MLILLPPSETKRDGGEGGSFDSKSLGYPSLNAQRRVLVRELRALARDPEAMMAALKLGRTQAAEVQRNRALTTSPTMAALDRYTGVLYDALDAPTLSAAARDFAGRHVVVHSALFGPVGALDLVPAYRFSHDSRLPGHPLKKHWGGAVSQALAVAEGLVLDLRSEAYVALGAAPAGSESLFLRVVTEAPGGQKRALNHFNKKSKGEFTRAILEHGRVFASAEELLDWAPTAGFRLHRGAPGELELVV